MPIYIIFNLQFRKADGRTTFENTVRNKPAEHQFLP